jgi:thioredoxin 1
MMWLVKGKYVYLGIFSLLSLLLAAGCASGPALSPASSATREITISLPNTNTSRISITDQGRLVKNSQITSADGKISLAIDSGTTLLDAKNTPLQSIKVAIDPSIPVPPKDAEIIGAVIDIQPQAGIISPSFRLTLKYEVSALPAAATENDIWIYSYNGNTWEMMRYKDVDTTSKRITTTISRLGKYSVLALTQPVVTPLTSQPAGLTSVPLPQALKNGKPTLAEFGRGTCIPCKEMKPILENLAIEYQDRLNVPIVSVDEYNDLTNYYKVMAIPTQIIFDSSGKELYRHVGFWPKDQIITQLGKFGIK